jgi:hypothetical protein
MAYARKRKTTSRRRTVTRRRSAGSRSYARKRSSPVRRAGRSGSVRRSAGASHRQQTLRLVIQTTGDLPASRPNVQTALLGQAATEGPKKARHGGGH